MKILRIISSIDPRGGGPTEGARKIDTELLMLGHIVEVVCLDHPDEAARFSYPVPVHALGATKLGYRYSAELIPWIRKNAPNYDAVIVNGLWQYHSYATWRALAGTGIPYFVYTHGMLDPWFKHTYPIKHLKKWLYWPWAEYRVLRDASAVIFTCEEERLLARQSFWLYRANEAVTAYGTSSPPSESSSLSEKFLATHPELQGKRIVLFLSRIHEKKGCDLLIEAFAQVAKNNEHLHLVMAGPDQTGWALSLKEKAAELGISHRISWPGMLEGDAKWGAFYSAEVFCLPSHQENFGIVVAEALACGKPVLISNKVNIWREVEASNAGFVASDTVGGTANNLRNWLSLSPSEQIAMQSRARVCFAKNFHIQRAAERLLEIIRTSKNDNPR